MAEPEIKKTRANVGAVINTPTNTTMWYVTGTSANPTFGYTSYEGAVGVLYTAQPEYDYQLRDIKAKIGKLSKKKRGSLDGANSKDKRLNLITPVVMYGFIKSRFRLLERKRLSDRLEKIAKLMESARVLGQIAMADKIEERFGKLIREQELIACGYTEYIPRKLVDKFISITTTKIIKLTALKNYIRPIPKKVQRVLDEVRKKKLFDDYLVMHTDVNNTAVEKTKAEKKDPILFGVLNDVSDNLYHITSWTDEFCDLTFDQLIDKLELEKEEYQIEGDVAKAFTETIL